MDLAVQWLPPDVLHLEFWLSLQLLLRPAQKSLGMGEPILHWTDVGLQPSLRQRLLQTRSCRIFCQCCLELDNPGLCSLQLFVGVEGSCASAFALGRRMTLHGGCDLWLTLAFLGQWTGRLLAGNLVAPTRLDARGHAVAGGRGHLRTVRQTASDRLSSKTHFLLRPMDCR